MKSPLEENTFNQALARIDIHVEGSQGESGKTWHHYPKRYLSYFGL